MGTFERSEWDEILQKRQKELVRKHRTELMTAKRAALSASQVTGDQHWDLFVSILAGRLEELEGLKSSAQERLLDSDHFSAEELIADKLAVRLIGREVDALRWVMDLPKSLLEQGDKASELLEKHDEIAN